MATFMTTAFTAPDRRKKVVTYGKSSRPTPAPTATSEPPSPDRPRKQATTPHITSKKDEQRTPNGSHKGPSRAATTSPDIFDMPSDDEFSAYPARALKKPLLKRRVPAEGPGVVPANAGALKTGKALGNTSASSRKAEPARPAASATAKPSQAIAQAPKAPKPLVKSGEVPTGISGRRGRTPQPGAVLRQDGGDRHIAPRPIAKAKVVPRATPAVSAAKTQKPAKIHSTLPSRSSSVRASTKQSRDMDMDVFDMPSLGDELAPAPKVSQRPPTILRKESVKASKLSSDKHRKDHTESDDSTSSRKRKRKGSVSSTALKEKPVDEQETGASLLQRSAKHHKREGATSPGHKPLPPSAAKAAVRAQNALPAIDKPRRTRVRTVPVLTQPSTMKAQSAPAMLRAMLSGRPKTQPSPVAEVHESTVVEDDTMYEIPDDMTTPRRPASNSISGSITPRQKALFGSLLGTASKTPPMPSISKLQLTDSKPKSLLGALSGSKSELTPSARSQKAKLITNLKHVESSSDEEASESESGSDGEVVAQPRKVNSDDKYKSVGEVSRPRQTKASEEMDVDIDPAPAADSQTSQTSAFNSRQRLTYAKSRSYLQEAHPEDDFLMSMDMDDPLTSASQTRDSQTEEEEEASQVRPNHELRRQGQNSTFEWENLMLIDDISSKSISSIRRNGLLELCTKMADATYTHELLDSSLVQQFLNNLTSQGEVIFDFTAAVATIFMLQANPTFTMLDQIHRSEHVAAFSKLLDNNTEVRKIAKSRKTNLSRIAQDSVTAFHSTVLASHIWSPQKPESVSPQLVAAKALELLVLNLREAGNMGSIIDQDTLTKLVDILYSSSERCRIGKTTTEDALVQRSILLILEAVSLTKQKPLTWSTRSMQRLATSMSVSFQNADAPTITVAVKLCMNLTNNKPKACDQFSEAAFVQSLVQSIIERINSVQEALAETQRTEALDTLILSLGAMINLTEHSDQARQNTDDGKQLLETLVKTFVEGSARTMQVS
jgi:hypothetical protein